jgi:hypothetical protein
MRTLFISMAALAVVSGVPAAAQNFNNGPYDRAWANREEVLRSRERLEAERRDVQLAEYYGDRDDVREERRDYKRARKEYQRDARDYQRSRQTAQNWQRGRNYGYNRPDPRYNGYYADNYYRSGDYYRPRPLAVNDRIYRGQDNRYYCRRSDGTTGLILGALGGGVLGNVIAPGGSKTLGSILGGGLGAVLGSSIDRNNVTCR